MDYLMSMDSISSMIVSHDSKFLDTVCTHIIHYENRKLKNYRGNLSEFVKRVPEAASYYSLEASTITWNFPKPGYLEGVKTKDKAILKMTQMCFTYPGADKPQITDASIQVGGLEESWLGGLGGLKVEGWAPIPGKWEVGTGVAAARWAASSAASGAACGRASGVSLRVSGNPLTLTLAASQVSLSSRVGCIGANGAGKSTLIKVLTGEMEASSGIVWRHPNCRIAYVAQHAFHHIEKHLDLTPNQVRAARDNASARTAAQPLAAPSSCLTGSCPRLCADLSRAHTDHCRPLARQLCTPAQYIQWRYASGEDREEQEKDTVQLTAEDLAKLMTKIKMDDGSKRAVEKILGRRKAKGGGYEYEVSSRALGCAAALRHSCVCVRSQTQCPLRSPPTLHHSQVRWRDMSSESDSWHSRQQLEAMGAAKLVSECDMKEAARLGLMTRPLTTAAIEKHLVDFGLEAEFASHSLMKGLSGGQKVKVRRRAPGLERALSAALGRSDALAKYHRAPTLPRPRRWCWRRRCGTTRTSW